MSQEKIIDDHIDELVGALRDPIIAFPSPWMDSIPERLKSLVPLQRLVQLMKKEKGIATDVEALIYMYPLSLERPMGHDWTEIYLYLGGQVIPEMPDDVKAHSLNDQQMGMLMELKRWIYNQRIKARKERQRAEKRQRREKEVVERKALQPSLFDF